MRLFAPLLLVFLAAGCVAPAERSVDPAPEAKARPVVNRDALERRVHELINGERQKHGLAPLDWDLAILPIARDHSEDMAQRDYFDHRNPDGLGPADRGYAVQYYCRKDYERHYTQGIAENIFMNHLYSRVRIITYSDERQERIPEWRTAEEIARLIVKGWMNSPGHRENILNPNFDRQAIGVAITPDDEVFTTQNLC